MAEVWRNPKYQGWRKAILDCAREAGARWLMLGRLDDPDNLTFFACATIIPSNTSVKLMREVWASMAGKSYKELTSLPRRIEGIAQEIETINQNSLLAPGNQINKNSSYAKVARHTIQDLPHVMRVWARALQERFRVMEREARTVFPRHWKPIDYLQWTIEEGTGRPHDRLVAELLNATDDVLNPAKEGEQKNPKFNELMLAQQRARRRKRKTVPFST
jgi:hypothetical protein